MATEQKRSSLGKLTDLLLTERKEISYIMIYAVMSGLIYLSLPLGIQSLIGFVSSGQVSTSVIVLIFFILIGIVLSGGLQVMQLYLVEHIRQRLYARTAFEFASRLPNMRMESVFNRYPAELANRFFDVVSLQKGLTKLLTDFATASLQILFGLILLSFYHPYFILFSLFLVMSLALVLWITGPKGLKTNLYASKYKYQTANWLQELSRSLRTFKLAGYSDLPLSKTDHYVGNYLQARKSHFRVLVTQYISFIGFKALIITGLLVLGTMLLINQEINLGQFVASEIIIIITMTAIEKVLVKLDAVYDVLTSIEKLDQVREVPLEKTNKLKIEELPPQQGFSLQVKNLSYRYPGQKEDVLKGLNLNIAPGEKIAICGENISGKSTLINLLLGFLHGYEGVIAYNKVSLRDLHRDSLHNYLGNDSQESLFDGTVLENVQLGRSTTSLHDVLWALEVVGLTEYVQNLPEGLETQLAGGPLWVPDNVAQRLVIARAIAKKPRLLILSDFLRRVDRKEKKRILNMLTSTEFDCTILFFSNDPDVMHSCDRHFLMKKGKLEEVQITSKDLEDNLSIDMT
jgi:ABC-type bacteriocin/lantibiotic exporter with double-glycine peptidase domain